MMSVSKLVGAAFPLPSYMLGSSSSSEGFRGSKQESRVAFITKISSAVVKTSVKCKWVFSSSERFRVGKPEARVALSTEVQRSAAK